MKEDYDGDEELLFKLYLLDVKGAGKTKKIAHGLGGDTADFEADDL